MAIVIKITGWFPQAKSPRLFSCLLDLFIAFTSTFFCLCLFEGNFCLKSIRKKNRYRLISAQLIKKQWVSVTSSQSEPVVLKLSQLSTAPSLPFRPNHWEQMLSSLGVLLCLCWPISTFVSQVKLFWSLSCCGL